MLVITAIGIEVLIITNEVTNSLIFRLSLAKIIDKIVGACT